jgi:hypothetical protein
MIARVPRRGVDSRHLRDPDAQRRHAALLDHARAVCEQARRTTAHSKTLAWLSDERQEGALISRCRWCGRYEVADRWFEARLMPPVPSARTGHGICGDCTEAASLQSS